MKDRKTVCVQGLGFVGAAMALAIASAKDKAGVPLYNVIGIDVPNVPDTEKLFLLMRVFFPLKIMIKN